MPTKPTRIANQSENEENTIKKSQALHSFCPRKFSFLGDFVLQTFNQKAEHVEVLTGFFLFSPISISSHINIVDLAKWQVHQRSNYIAYIKF